MKKLMIILGMIGILLTATPALASTIHYDLELQPTAGYVWSIGVDGTTLRIYDVNDLSLDFTHLTTGIVTDLAFSANGTYVYLTVNNPSTNTAYVKCYTSAGFIYQSQAALPGIACRVIVASNGYVYATSQDPEGMGFVDKFSAVSLTPQVSMLTQKWPQALAEDPSSGDILVGGAVALNSGSVGSPDLFTPIYIHNSVSLMRSGGYFAGLQHMNIVPADDYLLVENSGIDIVDATYEWLMKGLSVVELTGGSVMLEIPACPEIVRGTCYEPFYEKTFFCAFNGEQAGDTTLFYICNLDIPKVEPLDILSGRRIVKMVATPFGIDQIKLIGIDSNSNNLFEYILDANSPPTAQINPEETEGPAPYMVIWHNDSYDCDGTIVQIRADWDNTDGTWDAIYPMSLPIIEHEYMNPGVYEVEFELMDDDGDVTYWYGSVVVN